MNLEHELHCAIERNEIFTLYQPQIGPAAKRISGVEALMRWLHPKREIVLPSSFIQVAEESGLILPLGERALRESCLAASRWFAQHGFDGRIAVNISAVQLCQEDFIDTVLRLLGAIRLPPEKLELEVTESVVTHGVDLVTEKMHVLGESGIKIAIDDVGTGPSSLSNLRQFQADRLKIDESLIRELPQSAEVRTIVQAMIAMGRSLGLKVNAEGVETGIGKDTADLGCEEAQGYLYVEPMEAADLVAWLKTWC